MLKICCFRPKWHRFNEVPAEGGRQRESAERSGSHTFRCSHTESPGSHDGGLEGPWCTVAWTATPGPKKLLGTHLPFRVKLCLLMLKKKHISRLRSMGNSTSDDLLGGDGGVVSTLWLF